MKKLMLFALGLSMMACQQNKIGYVDNVKLLEDYQEKIDIEAKYNSKVDALTKKRDSISQAFQLELQEFQLRSKKMSQKNAQDEYTLLQQRGQIIGQQLQQEELELQQSSKTEMDSLVSKVRKEVKTYGKANGFTYILTGGNGGAVLYGQDPQNLTETIVKILNDKYKQ
nr:OmpH family outer membrane protein [Allomuricauda sp.]